MTTDVQTEAQRPWLLTAGLGLGVLLGLAAIRWLPGRRRKTRVDLIRERAEELTGRLGDLASDAGERAGDVVADLKQRVRI
jgi:hypothetical protein